MGAESVWDLLDEDRAWLEVQPGLRPWPEGRAMLMQQLTLWAVQYSGELHASPITPEDARFAQICRRLWLCWRHHWHQAAEVAPEGKADGLQVAERIRTGEGYTRGKRLGGDPLRDVVLAEAVLQRDSKATECFTQEYESFCISQGRGIDRRIDEDAHDWWCLLLDRLAGYSRTPGKLASFGGRCGLKCWLGRVASNFARDAIGRPQEAVDEADAVDRTSTPAETAEVDDCLDLLARFVRHGLDGLSDDDRLLLCLLLLDRLSGKKAAEELQIVPGNVVRRRAKAESRLRERLLGTTPDVNPGVDDCLELVSQPRNWKHFAEVFCDQLRQVRPMDDPVSLEMRP